LSDASWRGIAKFTSHFGDRRSGAFELDLALDKMENLLLIFGEEESFHVYLLCLIKNIIHIS